MGFGSFREPLLKSFWLKCFWEPLYNFLGSLIFSGTFLPSQGVKFLGTMCKLIFISVLLGNLFFICKGMQVFQKPITSNLDFSLNRLINGAHPVVIVSYVIGCLKNMAVKVNTCVQIGPPALLAHLSACLLSLCLLLVLLIFCSRCLKKTNLP